MRKLFEWDSVEECVNTFKYPKKKRQGRPINFNNSSRIPKVNRPRFFKKYNERLKQCWEQI